jgi:hypothetical protein
VFEVVGGLAYGLKYETHIVEMPRLKRRALGVYALAGCGLVHAIDNNQVCLAHLIMLCAAIEMYRLKAQHPKDARLEFTL